MRYKLANFEVANTRLDSLDWEDIISGDIDQAWEKWKQAFMSVMEEHIPQSTIPDKHNLPWLSMKSMRARNLAYRKAKRSNKSNHWYAYKRKRNQVASLTIGEVISDTCRKAATLNKFFSNCFNTCLPLLSVNDRDVFANANSSECPSELLCTKDDVLDLLLSLDTTKAN